MTEPLRVGVIGAGAVAQVAHLPVLTRRSDVEVSAICDNDVAKAQALADRFRIESVYDDIEELLRHDTPDAIVVCTPNHLHGAHVRTGLSAGVHVLCERPLALTPNAVDEVIAAQRRADRVLLTGMNYRYRSDVQAVRSFLERGELGRIHMMRGGWYAFRPSRQALGWRRQLAQSGGGVILDLGLGLIDLALWLARDAVPERVMGSATSYVEGEAVDDAGCAIIQCTNGLAVLIDVSWHHVGSAERFWFEVHGTEGSATISPLSVHKEMHDAPVNVTPTGASGRENAFTSSYAAEWASFLAMVRGDVTPPDLAQQALNHRVISAIYRSIGEHTAAPV